MRVSAIQMTSGRNVAGNLEDAGKLIAAAASEGAKLIVLPENFSFLGAEDAERLAAAESAESGPAQNFLRDQARQHGVWIVGGTIPIAQSDGRARSRSLLIDPEGVTQAQYDKIHLFDVNVPGKEAESYRESATTQCGTEVVTAPTPFGRIGMSVCYDLRFPAQFHRMSVLGAELFVVPAAFTVPTGRVHWQTLLQARAIESLAYVVAAGQVGEHAGGRLTFGHSMIVGPWGETIACRESGPGVVSADLDMIGLKEIRQSFPVLEHRREL
jgi:nitrilase